MKKEKNDSNTRKKTYNNFNLYRKEQLVICAVVLCFVLSAVVFPPYREKLMPNDISEISDSTVSPSEEPAENKTAEEIIVDNIETDKTGTNNDSSDNAAESNNNETNNNQSSNVNSNNNANSTEPSVSTEPEKTPENNTSVTAPSQKEWVPPVYEIIHHEAIYETKRIVICNYCSETFNTVGEFQVHKNAHGG